MLCIRIGFVSFLLWFNLLGLMGASIWSYLSVQPLILGLGNLSTKLGANVISMFIVSVIIIALALLLLIYYKLSEQLVNIIVGCLLFVSGIFVMRLQLIARDGGRLDITGFVLIIISVDIFKSCIKNANTGKNV